MSHEKEEGLTADELLGPLTGLSVIGLAALQAGGKLELKLDDLKDLDGRGIAISIDERSGTATVEVMDYLSDAVQAEPTHEAPPTVQ